MKRIPQDLLQSLKGVEGFDKEAFEEVHASAMQVTSIRINPGKVAQEHGAAAMPYNIKGVSSMFTICDPVPWTRYGCYLSQRPSFTFDPLFHAGLYYVQEASSMFLEQAVDQLCDISKPLKVLDLCAAPGGKSTHLQSLISADSLLVSNEVIRGRTPVLTDNIIKWGCPNVIVSSNDPSAFQKLEGFFDVMVVDAPCSGSGLFRRDEEAVHEWSLNNVQLCRQRQQRILADALPALKENGLLIYSTCSYSKEEDEDIADWLVEEWGMESCTLQLKSDWNIITSHSGKGATGYRFYPDKVKGEGFFLACFTKTQHGKEPRIRPAAIEKVSAGEQQIIKPWLREEDFELMKETDRFFMLPATHVATYAHLRSVLNIRYAGIVAGQIMKNKLVPEHSLAMSRAVAEQVPANELSYEQAIKYLQRQELNFNTSGKGWQLARYDGHNLGWINVLPNRINNYYPKEMRILKQSNDASFEK